MSTTAITLRAVGLVLGLMGTIAAQPLIELRVNPSPLNLDHGSDVARFVVTATHADGTTREVTAKAGLRLEDPTIADLEGSTLVPRANGETRVLVTLGDAKTEAPVRVRGVEQAPAVSFEQDVVPVLTRRGCNAGGCHGAATGKNGFRLSLFGFDPAKDHERLTRELRGRRINPSAPAESLILTKPTVQVTHKGGPRFELDSPDYDVLRAWVAAGAPNDVGRASTLTGIRIEPREVVLGGPGKRQQFLVTATYADGSDRDVTELALISSSNGTSAAVDAHGLATSGSSGEAFIMARFGSFAEVSQVLVLDESAERFAWPDHVKPVNDLDAHVQAKLRKMRLLPPPVCDDATFVRRVHLDVVNVLPTVAETRRFLDDPDPDKRRKLVDALLQRNEFSDVWAMEWAEVLRIESRKLERKGMHRYTDFLRKSFREGLPFDEMIRRLLVAQGGNFAVPEANYYLIERNPRSIAENVAQTFLGIRIQCAQCHNHPFERWTMDDYYGFAAFFARVATKRSEDPREFVVYSRGGGEVRHAKNNAVVPPRFLGGDAPKIARGADRRQHLARWLTGPENPWFAANVANRVFARFMGRGLVQPVDDVRVSNPPSHPELHRKLGQQLRDNGYDVKALIRDICASRTYQQAVRDAPAPASALAGAAVRRLTAEQLLDAIAEVTGVDNDFAGLPAGARATEVADGDPRSRFLDIFGRPRRQSACTCDRRNEPTLTQALHLINGDTITTRILAKGGRLRRHLDAKSSDEDILNDLFLAAYSRPPKESETRRLLHEIAEAEDRIAILTDVFWTVLNSKEFLFNH